MTKTLTQKEQNQRFNELIDQILSLNKTKRIRPDSYTGLSHEIYKQSDTISKIYKGKKNVSPGNIEKLALKFMIDFNYFYYSNSELNEITIQGQKHQVRNIRKKQNNTPNTISTLEKALLEKEREVKKLNRINLTQSKKIVRLMNANQTIMNKYNLFLENQLERVIKAK